MDVKKNGSQPSSKGPAEYFTGTVRIDPLYAAPAPARMFAANVAFEPGARTNEWMERVSDEEYQAGANVD